MNISPPSRRRLLQVFNRYQEPGGEEAWVANLAKSSNLPTCYFNSSDWAAPNAPSRFSQALRMIDNPSSIHQLRQIQKEINAEAWILHNVFPVGSAAVYREAHRMRIPLIQYVHNFRPVGVSGYLRPSDLQSISSRSRVYFDEIARGSWQNSRVKTAWFATVLLIAQLFRWFDAITAWIAVSDFMRDQFIRAGFQADRIFTLRHFWKPFPEGAKRDEQPYYLFIGRLIELKGIVVLLNVWDRILAKEGKTGPKLVIIGEGPLQEKVKNRAKQNPLVDFRGPVSAEMKREILSKMRALITPSLCLESLGLVVYEAYDFAKPLLAARSGGLAEIVIHGETGLIHEPGDADGLYQQIMALESEPETRIRLGQNARTWLLENADEQKWRQRFREIVEFAIAAKE